MAGPAPSRSRRRPLRVLAALGALAAVAGALKLGGAFDADDEPVDPAPIAAPPASKPTGASQKPRTDTFHVGGHPSAIAVGETEVFVTDAFTAELSLIEPEGRPGDVLAVDLPDPASSIAVSGGDLWLGYPEPRAVERRVAGPHSAERPIELDAFPSAIAADARGAWVLTESGVDRVDERGEVTDHLSAGGFATAMAVEGEAIWIVADNREVRRFDAATLEPADELAEVPDAAAIAVGEGFAWILSAAGELTRLDPESLRAVGEPLRIEGALALEVGEGAVWVTSSKGTVTRVDPESGQVSGDPVPVGDEPASISVGGGGVWVANAGAGTVTRIDP